MDQPKLNLAKVYNPLEVERKWYETWEREELFKAHPRGSNDESYCIVIPPPNVTGNLHMGHALNNGLQDVLVRYHRMQGHDTLWLPGMDHAGIATQNVVERQLAAAGTNRHEVGREEFIKRVWEWRGESGGQILNQLKRLGCSCDWDRERFTMDEGLSRAVREVFVKLYDEGLIYRGEWLINWCPRCHTALSDLEVEAEDHDGHFWHFRYPLSDGDGYVVVATTRPETMLGDTAVAIPPAHRDHEGAFRHLVGRTVMLPLMDREIPIVEDDHADPEKGTGIVKITPAHDFNDFMVGLRHNLERINILEADGHINANGGRFAGMDRYEAREAVVQAMDEAGYLVSVEDHAMSVGHCYRCHTVVEPYLSLQWFVRMEDPDDPAPVGERKKTILAQEAIEAVEDDRTVIVPWSRRADYFRWMHGIRDWCISRQIWWGHRIPAWTCASCGEIVVAKEDPTACPHCGGSELEQDPDVLDTWFSSALWPFSTLGWPDETEELKTYYPTSVLITAADILFFWVARMMMMGLHFRKEIPFHEVYLHSLVVDENGEKMSKTKGNFIDPLLVMDKYGTDAFRYALIAYTAQGRNVRVSDQRLEGYRNFINKVWNAARFCLMNAGDEEMLPVDQAIESTDFLADRWILNRCHAVTASTRKALDEFHFNEAAMGLYHFVWDEFCAWYLESIKTVIYGDDEARAAATRRTMLSVLGAICRMMHPLMPFVTEEIWSRIPGSQGRVMVAPYPSADDFPPDDDAEEQFGLVMDVVTRIRNIRSELHISPGQPVDLVAVTAHEPMLAWIDNNGSTIQSLGRVKQITTSVDAPRPPASANAIVTNVDLYVPLGGLLDLDKERARLNKELGKVEKDQKRVAGKLSNEKFLAKAPEHVIAKEKKKQVEFDEARAHLLETIAMIESS